MTQYNMYYDQRLEQWMVELRERAYPLHCGESFDLYIGKTPIPCQLELSDKWYVMMNDVSFYLRRNSQYKIKI